MHIFGGRGLGSKTPKLISIVIAASMLLAGCDVEAIKQLGAKVGIRGQEVATTATATLAKIRDLEPQDYSQRTLAAIVNMPINVRNVNNETCPIDNDHKAEDPCPVKVIFPDVKHESLEKQINIRITAYKQLGKAYEAIQQLSDKNFGELSQNAADKLVGAVNSLNAIPDLPALVSKAIPTVASIIVEKKQANAIKKFNTILKDLSKAYKELWDADKVLWASYFQRVKSAYASSLRNLPDSRFDIERIRDLVEQPYADEYLITIYKANEASRLDKQILSLEVELDAVSEAFRLLNKAHEALEQQKPSFADVNAFLDRIITVLEAAKEKE